MNPGTKRSYRNPEVVCGLGYSVCWKVANVVWLFIEKIPMPPKRGSTRRENCDGMDGVAACWTNAVKRFGAVSPTKRLAWQSYMHRTVREAPR